MILFVIVRVVNRRAKVLGVPFFTEGVGEAVDLFTKLVEHKEKRIVGFVNPEIVVQTLNDEVLRDFYINRSSVNFADGMGVLWAAKPQIKERITGTDFVLKIAKLSSEKGFRIFLLGGAKGTAKKAKKTLEKKYPNCQIVGYRDGYFDLDENDEVVAEINSLKVDILMVCLGCPKQERWIVDNFDKLKVGLVFGNGGALDYYAGVVKRAPKWMQDNGLEWLFRITQDFSLPRLKRQLRLAKFVWLVFLQRLKSK